MTDIEALALPGVPVRVAMAATLAIQEGAELIRARTSPPHPEIGANGRTTLWLQIRPEQANALRAAGWFFENGLGELRRSTRGATNGPDPRVWVHDRWFIPEEGHTVITWTGERT